jgi:hypothetical protein
MGIVARKRFDMHAASSVKRQAALPPKIARKVMMISVLALALSGTGYTGSHNGPSSGPKWKTVDLEYFTFKIPSRFKKTGMTGVEHYLEEYLSADERFLVICEATASYAYDRRRQPEMEDYQEADTVIDGRRAVIRTFSQTEDGRKIYKAELNVGDWPNGRVELYMGFESRDKKELSLARMIFHSIRFKKDALIVAN